MNRHMSRTSYFLCWHFDYRSCWMVWCQTITCIKNTRLMYVIVDERICSLNVFTKFSANIKLAPYHRLTKTTDSSEKRNIISTYIINCHRPTVKVSTVVITDHLLCKSYMGLVNSLSLIAGCHRIQGPSLWRATEEFSKWDACTISRPPTLRGFVN